MQVAAAHARSLDLEHDVARPRRRIGKLAQRELAVTEEDDAEHGKLLTGLGGMHELASLAAREEWATVRSARRAAREYE